MLTKERFLVVVIVAGICLRYYGWPPMISAGIVWCGALLWIITATKDFTAWTGWMIGGAIMNVLAIFSNGGLMPVVGLDASLPDIWWQPVTSATHFLPLCDILTWHLSIGDILILSGCLGSMIKTFPVKSSLAR